MDPRIARTRTSLRDALFSLTRERPVDEISISDIAERAGINRSTYYQHYSDKDTLLAEALDAVIDDAIGPEPPLTEEHGARILDQYLRHVEENAALYRRLLGEGGSATIQVRMSRRLQLILVQAFERGSPHGLVGVPTEVAAAAIAGSALATIRAWLDTSPLPPAQAASGWIWTAITAHGAIPEDEADRLDRFRI
ncbi:TetR/AcrR family transcriptional regulator [Pseudactinotalea terrae]|uniref:TetR/AcrR family transcriptional regulator n=1 Tax=Pseudactinotalea terrae TaxID=1743262 RepID=UPI00139123AF|nr:TetR/AcrR family transcriptional regulator [Pseudactinotalea terrae]